MWNDDSTVRLTVDSDVIRLSSVDFTCRLSIDNWRSSKTKKYVAQRIPVLMCLFNPLTYDFFLDASTDVVR